MASEYNYLNQSDCLLIDGVNDGLKFHKLMVILKIRCQYHYFRRKSPVFNSFCFIVLSAMHLVSFFGVVVSPFPQEALDAIQICKDDQEQAFAMLAAVLWLGNISFQVIDNENHVEVLPGEGKIDMLAGGSFLFLMVVLHVMLFVWLFLASFECLIKADAILVSFFF